MEKTPGEELTVQCFANQDQARIRPSFAAGIKGIKGTKGAIQVGTWMAVLTEGSSTGRMGSMPLKRPPGLQTYNRQ